MRCNERPSRLPTVTRQRKNNHDRQHLNANAVADVGPPVRADLLKCSVLGRPRALSDAKIVRILEWHDSRMTLKELAASLGVSTSTVVHVIQSRGAHYKQAAPEERAAALSAHRSRRRALEVGNWM